MVAGGLGAVSAALAGLTSRTLVKAQEAAAAHLRAYFDQSLEFSRYLAAERIIADAGLTQEQRAQVVTSLVHSMVSGPGAVPAAQEAGGRETPSDGRRSVGLLPFPVHIWTIRVMLKRERPIRYQQEIQWWTQQRLSCTQWT